jgi:3-phenylpropionate/trans-cinnamate dioxygenase ferredoxin reductase component
MEQVKYVLVGGGLTSYKAIAGIRSVDEEGSILLVTKEPHVPYDRPPLTKGFLRGETEKDAIFYESAEDLAERNVTVKMADPVVAFDTAAKTVTLESGESYGFDKALYATGGHPFVLDLPGGDLEGVYTLRTVENSERIKAEAREGQRAVVIGAGFIGMEIAASLTGQGVDVTVVETLPRIWARFVDETLSGYFEDLYALKGVTLRTGETVARFEGTDRVTSVVTASGEELACDFVVMAVGIRPNTSLAEEAGLEVEDGVVVDEYMRSSHPDIYAAGDAARFYDPIFGKQRRVEHWGQADYSGELAGKNMAGAEEPYDMVTYAWSEIFDQHLEFVGDETEYDEVWLRGRPGKGPFTVLYLLDDALRAFFGVNTGTDEFGSLEALIRSGQSLREHRETLEDPEADLDSLVA